MAGERDYLIDMLNDGWSVEGYSNTIMAGGAMTYSILLRKGSALNAVTVIISNGAEIGRTLNTLAPAPAAKKGWF